MRSSSNICREMTQAAGKRLHKLSHTKNPANLNNPINSVQTKLHEEIPYKSATQRLLHKYSSDGQQNNTLLQLVFLEAPPLQGVITCNMRYRLSEQRKFHNYPCYSCWSGDQQRHTHKILLIPTIP